MNKKIHLISGLPRAGNTLLSSILNQNPAFHAGSSSLVDTLFTIRNIWEQNQENSNIDIKTNVLRGITEGYFKHTSKQVCFDQSGSWLSYLEMIEHILGREVRVIVPVRDIRAILSDLEKLWRKNSHIRQLPIERAEYSKFQTVRGRCEAWTADTQLLGMSFSRLRDVLKRGFASRLLFVRYEELTTMPRKVMDNIYSFLEENYYSHDFDNIEHESREGEITFGIENLHDIRQKLEPEKPDWDEILGNEVAEIYKGANFWDYIEKNEKDGKVPEFPKKIEQSSNNN